jgi:hypothetical protein
MCPSCPPSYIWLEQSSRTSSTPFPRKPSRCSNPITSKHSLISFLGEVSSFSSPRTKIVLLIDQQWLVYERWSKSYGPLYLLRYGLDDVIILSDYATAHDLLDNKGDIYSSRPHRPMANDCVYKGLYSALLEYGPKLKEHQRVQASFLGARISQSYRILQDVESKQVILNLLTTNNFIQEFHRFTTSTIFAFSYGRRLEGGDEPEIAEFNQLGELFVRATRVGKLK